MLLILECIFGEQQWFLFNLLYVSSRRIQWHPTPVLLPGKSHGWRSLVGCSHRVAKSRARLSDFTFTFHLHALEKEMATHSSVLAWRIPGTGEPGGLSSMGSHRVGHDWSDLAAAACLTQEAYFWKNIYNVFYIKAYIMHDSSCFKHV